MDTLQLTTYTVKSKSDGYIWLFKYHLNGAFQSFEILDGQLSEKQMVWLFAGSNFPATENLMRDVWMKKSATSKFEIIKAAPVLDFELLWTIYNLKVAKDKATKSFSKLNDGEKVKCFLAQKPYEKHLQRTSQAKAHLATWINQKRFNDEY